MTPRRHRCRECAAIALAWASLSVTALAIVLAMIVVAVHSTLREWSTIGLYAIPVGTAVTLAVVAAIQAGRTERASWHR